MFVKPRLAATVILLRPAPKGFEVFLTRRPEGMAFLGGMYCFPGGTLRKDDCAKAVLQRTRGLAPVRARAILGAEFAPSVALGLWVAAVRELFEETGVLLATDESESSGCPAADAVAAIHRALEDGGETVHAWLRSSGLVYDLAGLAHYSRWQTPSQFTMRFDTHFFLAALPEGQTPLATTTEVAHSLWLTPDAALERFEKNRLPMIFPTFTSLRTLADFTTLESVWKEYPRE